MIIYGVWLLDDGYGARWCGGSGIFESHKYKHHFGTKDINFAYRYREDISLRNKPLCYEVRERE